MAAASGGSSPCDGGGGQGEIVLPQGAEVRRRVLARRVDRVGRLQREERREECQRGDRYEQAEAEHGDAVFAQAAPGVFAEGDAGFRLRLRSGDRCGLRRRVGGEDGVGVRHKRSRVEGQIV